MTRLISLTPSILMWIFKLRKRMICTSSQCKDLVRGLNCFPQLKFTLKKRLVLVFCQLLSLKQTMQVSRK